MDVQFTRNMIIRHEGWRLVCYTDSVGVPTIGVGYNLLQAATLTDLPAAGCPSAPLLRSHKAALNNLQVATLLDITFKRAVQVATIAAPNFNVLPNPVQSVLTDMLFNLGPNRAAGFVHFWVAIHNNDWPGAASQLLASKWAHQVPNRVADLVKLLQTTPPTLKGEYAKCSN